MDWAPDGRAENVILVLYGRGVISRAGVRHWQSYPARHMGSELQARWGTPSAVLPSEAHEKRALDYS